MKEKGIRGHLDTQLYLDTGENRAVGYSKQERERDLRELLGAHVLLLLLMNMLHQNTLVLEYITLYLQIEAVIPTHTQNTGRTPSYPFFFLLFFTYM